MTGEEVRNMLAETLPQEEIHRLCAQYGVLARQRQLHLGMLV